MILRGCAAFANMTSFQHLHDIHHSYTDQMYKDVMDLPIKVERTSSVLIYSHLSIWRENSACPLANRQSEPVKIITLSRCKNFNQFCSTAYALYELLSDQIPSRKRTIIGCITQVHMDNHFSIPRRHGQKPQV